MKNFYSGQISLFSSKIKQLRNAFKMSLKELAEKSSIGIESIKNYERAVNYPSVNNLSKLSKVFSISIDGLLLDQTNYPSNLKLLKTAEKLEQSTNASQRNHIMVTAKSFLGSHATAKAEIKQDSDEIKLSADIHENIKSLKNVKNIPSTLMAEKLDINLSQVSHYQHSSTPPLEKLPLLSDIFDTSIHYITTGKALNFQFKDSDFAKTIFLSDKFLSFEHQKFLIEMMEAILKK